MPTEFYYPKNVTQHDIPAGHDDASNSGGANKGASTQPSGGRLGPMSHDDIATYVTLTMSAVPKRQAVNMDWPLVGTLGSVFSLGFRSLAGAGAHTRECRFTNAAGATSSSTLQSASTAGVWATVGPSDVSNAANWRPGGGAWSPADFGDDKTLMIEFWASTNGGNSGIYTSGWGQLEYLPPGGGFVFLLGLAGLGALPFIGAMDFGQFMRYLSWRRAHHPRHTILSGDEVRQAWRELREYRYPRFFLPAL